MLGAWMPQGGNRMGLLRDQAPLCTPFPRKLEHFILRSWPSRTGNFPSPLLTPLVHGASLSSTDLTLLQGLRQILAA